MNFFNINKKSFTIMCCFLFTQLIHAGEITSIHIKPSTDVLAITWNALEEKWTTSAIKDSYFGDYVPLIEVSVTTGDEQLIALLPNCYYRGVLTNQRGVPVPDSTVFLNTCDNAVPFLGFVASGDNMYLIEKDVESSTGISMRLEQTSDDISGYDEFNTGDNGWKEGGSGGALTPSSLYPRENNPDNFPSIDIYVDPSFRTQVGEENYINRIMETFAASNTMYQQSAMKQLHLSAIIRVDQDISVTSSQGNILHGLEKIRKYTVLPDSADISMVYTGGEFKMPYLWGWAEGGYSCELQQAVAEGNNINTHNIAKAATAIIDLPTLIQRAWIFAHEIGHTLGMYHITNDPLAYGVFQPALALKDYVAGCLARSASFETCAYDPQTKKFVDYYSCE